MMTKSKNLADIASNPKKVLALVISSIKNPLWNEGVEDFEIKSLIRELLQKCSGKKTVEMLKEILSPKEKTTLLKTELESFFQNKAFQSFENYTMEKNEIKTSQNGDEIKNDSEMTFENLQETTVLENQILPLKSNSIKMNPSKKFGNLVEIDKNGRSLRGVRMLKHRKGLRMTNFMSEKKSRLNILNPQGKRILRSSSFQNLEKSKFGGKLKMKDAKNGSFESPHQILHKNNPEESHTNQSQDDILFLSSIQNISCAVCDDNFDEKIKLQKHIELVHGKIVKLESL